MAKSNKKDETLRNGSGYIDSTAHEAITNVERDRIRFQKLLDTIFAICELSGFHIDGRIVITDKKTGKTYR